MVSSDKTADQNVSSHNLQLIVTPRGNITAAEEIHDTQIHSSEPDGAESIPSMLTIINNVKNSGATTACASQSDTLSHDSRPLQSGQDIPSIIREKVSKDGYNWRKYGQKHVKGNRFIRSYYKCTYPNCQAKKQLEQQSNTGQITDTICIGHHNHRRTQLNTAQPLDHVLPAVEDKVSVEHGLEPQHIKPLRSLPISALSPTDELKAAHLQLTWAKDEVHNNESPEPKRRKKSNSNSDLTADPRSTSGSRVVVQTSSEVDFVNDGYRWRKYGQKQVKGNTNPRSYYRCSNPGCLVKKHVERASHDSKIVITTYEGQHDHEIPPGRAVSFNAATKTQTMTINVKPGTQSGRDAVCVETGERSCLDSESRLSEQLNGDSVSKLKGGDMVESGMIILHSEGNESKLLKQEQQNDNSGTKENSAGSDIICHSSSEVPCRSNEQLKDEVKTKSERSKDCIRVVGGNNDTQGQESEFSKQSTCDAESSQS